MIGGDGAPTFGDDGGMRRLSLVAHALRVIDDVVGEFLEGVVDAGLEEIGLRAIVIDAEAAAHVQVLEAGAGAVQVLGEIGNHILFGQRHSNRTFVSRGEDKTGHGTPCYRVPLLP